MKNDLEFWEFPQVCAVRNEMKREMRGWLIVSGAVSPLCEGVFVQRRQRVISASYWSFLHCIARARVEWGYVRRGRRWERKGMDGTREEEAADLTIWWEERRWCSAVALWGCWPSTWRRSFTDLPEKPASSVRRGPTGASTTPKGTAT